MRCPICQKKLKGNSIQGMTCVNFDCAMYQAALTMKQWETLFVRTKVVVIIEGRCLSDVFTGDGVTNPEYILVDRDDIDNGKCIVCHDDYDYESEEPCRNCGYDNDEDNALACAVKILAGVRCGNCGLLGNTSDTCSYCGQPIKAEVKWRGVMSWPLEQ